MTLAVFWQVKPEVTLEAWRNWLAICWRRFQRGRYGSRFLWLGPREGISIVEADSSQEVWRALNRFVEHVNRTVRLAVYFTDFETFLHHGQDYLAKAAELYGQLPKELTRGPAT